MTFLARSDGQAGLARALKRSAERAGVPINLVEHHFKHWASRTFAGGHHRVVVEGPWCADLDRWLADLPGADLDYHGHLVAEAYVISVWNGEGRTNAWINFVTVEHEA